jgi:hypothetical protein
MKRNWGATAALLSILSVLLITVPCMAAKKVVVLAFQNGSCFDSPVLGRMVSQMVESELSKHGGCHLVDRSMLSDIPYFCPKIDPTNSSTIDRAIPHIRTFLKKANMDCGVIGVVKDIEVVSVGKSTSAARSSGLFSGLGGAVGTRTVTGKISLVMIMVSADESGSVCKTKVINKVLTETDVSVGALYGSYLMAIESGSSKFDETLPGKACRAAAKEAATWVAVSQ